MKNSIVSMKAYTSMRVGGHAVFFEPEDEKELTDLVHECMSTGQPYFLMGKGTNVIVRDGGYAGIIISTPEALCGATFTGDKSGEEQHKVIICGAGEALARICRLAAEHGLSGIEELSGIPGTVGGAVYMNAGAYGREISDVILSVRAYDVVNNKVITLSKNECEFGYRASIFKTRAIVILSAEIGLKPGVREDIEKNMADYTRMRNEKQPVDLPSAGSFFKRPEGDFAGRLIEAAGMKGVAAGGAKVSEKHAGFIVNTGGATAEDVLDLAEEIKRKVYEKFNKLLEEEPVIIGD